MESINTENSQEFWTMTNRTLETLDKMPKAIHELTSTYKHSPLNDSQAMQELNNGFNKELLKATHELCIRRFLFVIPDYMLGLKRALTPSQKILVHTPWACVRGVLESCSTIIWLLDTKINRKERITRILNLRLKSLSGQKTLANKDSIQNTERTQQNKETIKRIEARIEYLKEEARKLNIIEKRNRKDKLLGFGTGLPSISDRVTSTLNVGYDYAMLSSIIHGDDPAILNLTTKIIKQSEDKGAIIPYLNPHSVVYLMLMVIEWFAYASWACFKFFGWDLEKLQSILEEEYDRADITEELRFWREPLK